MTAAPTIAAAPRGDADVPARRRWPVEGRVFVVVGLLVLAAVPLGLGGLDAGAQLRLVAIPALLAGLPHGAMDPALARELGLWRDLRGAVRFHARYLLLAALTVAAFVVAPVVSLAAFLATTAWHFSGDWRDAAGAPTRLALGTALVSLPAFARPEQVGELYGLVTVPGAAVIADAQAAVGPLVLVAAVVGLAVLARRDRRAGIEVGLALVLALVAPPLVFFAVHFSLLHSPRHLREGIGVAGAARDAVRYALLAAAGLAVVGLLLAPRVGVDAAIASTVFVGLAALTTPHMLLVERAQRAAVLAPPLRAGGGCGGGTRSADPALRSEAISGGGTRVGDDALRSEAISGGGTRVGDGALRSEAISGGGTRVGDGALRSEAISGGGTRGAGAGDLSGHSDGGGGRT